MSRTKHHPAHRHLKKLQKLKRKHYHPLIHAIHKKHNISKKTLFYVKEYGPHSNVPKTIIRESIRILLLASLISSFGGLALENIKTLFVSLLPLLILLPVLNDMIGNYGTVISSKFSTLLYEGIIKTEWWKNMEIRRLFLQLIFISFLTAVFSSAVALAIASFSAYVVDVTVIVKVMSIVILDVLVLVGTLFLIAVVAGLHFFKKGEDPNNFLIPITTSVADFGNMIVMAVLVLLIF
jgi:cation transporter-like permease